MILARMILPQVLRHPNHLCLIPHGLSLPHRLAQIILRPHPRSHQQPLLVPLGTRAILPQNSTDEAELGMAGARHVVAPMVQVDDGIASWACLPPCLAGKGTELVDSFVLLALVANVRVVPACRAGPGPTPLATGTWLADRLRLAGP